MATLPVRDELSWKHEAIGASPIIRGHSATSPGIQAIVAQCHDGRWAWEMGPMHRGVELTCQAAMDAAGQVWESYHPPRLVTVVPSGRRLQAPRLKDLTPFPLPAATA